MFHRKLSHTLRHTMLALMLGASAALASAETLHVEIDTAKFSSKGWIDLLFLPATASTVASTVTLSDFVGFDGAAGAQPWGNVSGSLGSGYTLGNLPNGADLFHGVNFGGKISFNVDFAGVPDSAINRAQSTLSVSLFGADQTTLLGNGDAASGSLLQLYWLPAKNSTASGTTSYQIYDNIASVGPNAIAPVPEASTWAMMSVGIGLLGLIGRRRKACAPFATA
jgi:hypothetical protein